MAAVDDGTADLISDLPDDLLLHILSFLPAARDAARASVLSTRAPCLRFAVDPASVEADDVRRLIADVDATLAPSRAASPLPTAREAAATSTLMSCTETIGWSSYVAHRHAAGITTSRVAAWLRFGQRHLPCSARAEAMRLTLGRARLTVPAAVAAGAFRALSHVVLAAAADELRLGHLLSSSCFPRLRRLSLDHVDGLAALRLVAAAATLEDIRLVDLHTLVRLDVDAPELRLLRVGCCGWMVYYDDAAAMRISAPRLEALELQRDEWLVPRGEARKNSHILPTYLLFAMTDLRLCIR
uniref:F-box domain-containing protein n=1 Tax=Oryza punctata TaxID=4537 RepID=A0A0E0MN04_ORYPU